MEVIKLVLGGIFNHILMLSIVTGRMPLGNRGEVGTKPTEATPETKTFTQEQVNAFLAEHKRGLQTELGSTAERLKEMEAQLNQYRQKEEQVKTSKLEEQKEYEKLKEQLGQKENEYKNVISQKEQQLNDMKITNALTGAIIEFNAHADTIQLIKSQAQLNDKGDIVIKGKDANGIEQLLSVKEGVQQFLKDRPYLVKAGGGSGSGTPPSGSTPQGGGGSTDPLSDARELEQAIRIGDRKKVVEIKARIAAKRSSQPSSFI